MKDLIYEFLEAINKYKDTILFVNKDREISYNDFYNDASKVLKHINGYKVLIKCQDKYNYILAFTASLFNHSMPFLSNYESHVFDNYKFDLIIDDDFINEALKDNDYKLYEYSEFDMNEPMIVLLSSGTTATPKPVVLTHKCFMTNHHSATKASCLTPDYTYISILPLDHIFGFKTDFIFPVLNKGKVVFAYSLVEYFLFIQKYNPDKLNMTVSLFKNLDELLKIRTKEKLCPNLKEAFVAGSKCPKELVLEYKNKYNIEIHNSYGLTECSALVSINNGKHFKLGSDGYIIDCHKIRIGDNDEIIISGDAIMPNYLDLYEKGIYVDEIHTKDIGYIEDGYLYVIGRIDNLIVLENGFKIQPEPFEEKIKLNYDISDCVLYLKNNTLNLDIVGDKTQADLIKKDYPDMYLNINLVNEIKRNQTGKILRSYYKEVK